MDKVIASYTPEDGRITYLAGFLANANFQENLFHNNDSHSKLDRSQSFAVLAQALGDLNSKSSLLAEVTLGIHNFRKETELYVDKYTLEAISFDLGYRRHIAGDFWASASLGSMYPWRVRQRLTSSTTNFDKSEFDSIYSAILGIQYESTLFERPVSYDLRIKKYLSSQFDDQMSLGLSIGWRFGT